MNFFRRWKWLALAALVGLTAALVAWLSNFSQKHMRIVGPSMAEAFLGEHGKLVCEQCTWEFCFDLEETSLPDRLVCPSCGHVHSGNVAVKVLPGDLVRVESGDLRRYQVVAFEIPGEDAKLGVKRIVGLPGETVSITGGDIYIDGKIAPDADGRPWDESPVHYAMFDTHASWNIAGESSIWQIVEEPLKPGEEESQHNPRLKEYRFKLPAADGEQPIHWVEYRHRSSHDSITQGSGPILDNDAYNQSLSRPLNEVCDIRFYVSAKFEGRFALRIHDGWRDWIVELDSVAGRATLVQGGEEIASGTLPSVAIRDASPSYELTVRDGRIRLTVADNHTVLDHLAPPGTGERKASISPVAFGARSGRVLVAPFIAISRDTFYLDPVGLPQPWSMSRPLGPDEYFLLGDNVPVSTDSRHFGPVKRDVIRGIVRKLK